MKLSQYDDLTVTPSGELNRKTLAAMRMKQKENEPADTPAPRKHIRKVFVCAAAACAAVFLMGMGVRVFEYLTYVPGMGIVTAQQDEVYTLESVVNAGGYRIEAMSMLPVTKGENKGMWEVTLLTNKEIPREFAENPDYVKPICFVGEDGESYELTCSGGSGIGSRYHGYAEVDGAGDYVISWFDHDYTVTMKSMENSVWANYSYPVDQGLTVIAFPLAEGSKYMVFDVILDPESENMAYWAEHSETISYQPDRITITDAEGNTYDAPSRSGHGISIPDSEREQGINSLLSYKIETILTLDRAMEAPIERVEIGTLRIEFRGLSDTGFYTVTVPELGEVVGSEDLPNEGVYVDSHGISVRIDSVTAEIDEENNQYKVCMDSREPDISFDENVVDAIVIPVYVRPEDIGVAEIWEYYAGSASSTRKDGESGYVRYEKDITGYGDRKIRNGTTDVSFGDEIASQIRELWLTVEGEWVIDFSEEVKGNSEEVR